MVIQLGFVHAERQSVSAHGSRDVVIARNFNGIFGFHGFCSCIGVFQCPAFFEGRDVFRIGRYFAVNIFQLFIVDRIAVRRSVRDVADGLVVGIDACRGYRRTVCNGQSRSSECNVIPGFERSTAYACESRQVFIQAEFIAYFSLIRRTCYRFFLISNSQVTAVYGECRPFDGVYRSVYTRFFLRCNCDIVARFDGGFGVFDVGLQARDAGISGKINLASVDSVFNGRVCSCYGESVAGSVKGNSFAVFDVLFCCIATRCFQLPRTHDAVSAFGNTEVFFQLFHVQRVGDVSVRIDS